MRCEKCNSSTFIIHITCDHSQLCDECYKDEMKIKDGVNIQGIKIEMRPVLVYADRIWKKYGQKLVITSGIDSEHSAGSLHYYGYALDLRTRDFKAAEKKKCADELRLALGDGFDVVVEKTHIHVEYQAILL